MSVLRAHILTLRAAPAPLPHLTKELGGCSLCMLWNYSFLWLAGNNGLYNNASGVHWMQGSSLSLSLLDCSFGGLAI